MNQKINSIQEWIPIEKILENGIIKLKNDTYIKILKIIPINFNLKSELEKKSILNSYKVFLKTCNFNFQILIQSNKEDLSKHISNVEKNIIKENNKIKKISNNYINYIKKINIKKTSSSKKFYIILKNSKNAGEKQELEELIIEELNEKYFKIKECLSRCGNVVYQYNTKEEVFDVFFSFLNSNKFLSQ